MRIIHRDRRLNIAVTEDEHEFAIEVARARGLTISEVLREALRRERASLQTRIEAGGPL